MIRASSFGFAPGNPAAVNSAALQRAADCGGEVWVDGQGIADIREQIVIGSDTTLRFENGLYLRRQPCDGQTGYAMINRGAFTGETDQHIRIYGLRLMTNGVEHEPDAVQTERNVPGLNGMINFFHVKDLEIRDYENLDLEPVNFSIHICAFEDIKLENIRVEGRKDGIHLGRGRRFVIRHGIFRTFDDPIALNAHDYAISNPELGWIEDGVIEDCYDLNHEDTSGFFCRILAGSWVDWFPGMRVQHSDTVVHNHRLYRVFMTPDGREYTSVTPPTHEKGTVVLDGIAWVMIQEGDLHNCGCRNIAFRDIFLEKDRPVGFAFHFDKDWHSRSVYPGSELPVQENITFENIHRRGKIRWLMFVKTPIRQVRMTRCELTNTMLLLKHVGTEGVHYDPTDIYLDGCTFPADGTWPLVRVEGDRTGRISTWGSCVTGQGYDPIVPPCIGIGTNDIGLRHGEWVRKRPVK
jgi:hypothetical protein